MKTKPKMVSAGLLVLLLTGCQHIADLQACRPPAKSPELFTDHLGWDHASVDEIRCSNDALKTVVEAREAQERAQDNKS